MKKVQQGFTLIELMIVVAIIGILAAIAIPAYSDYITRSKWADTLSSVASIKTAIAECMDNNAQDPDGNCESDAQLEAYGVDTGANLATSTISTKYNALVSVEASPSVGGSIAIRIDADTGAPELGNLCVFDLTPQYQNGTFITWTPVVQTGGVACVKYVKGSSTAL